MTRLAYVRIGIDRDLYMTDGCYVVDPTGGAAIADRATGALSARASADVLDLRRIEAVPAKSRGSALVGGRKNGTGAPMRTVATMVRAATPLDRDGAAEALRRWRQDPEEVDRWRDAALATLNRALRAYRLVWRDPYAVEVTTEDLWLVRIGHTTAESIAAGTEGEEIDALRRSGGRMTASDRARPGEVIGAALAGSLVLLEGEELLAVAVREANHGRMRSAAEALSAATRLLIEDLGPGGTEALTLETLRPATGTCDRETVMQAVAAMQDVVDTWRAV